MSDSPRVSVCLGLLMAVLVVFGGGAGQLWAAGDERPNVVVILCDDLGYGDLGCYGHPTIKTPNLDRLASQGMRLTDCYSAAPVCSPARAGLMTGRVPSRTGVYDWIPRDHRVHLREGEVTTATLLKRAGYETAMVGKWHLNGKFNSDDQPQPSDHGFDHWFATQNNAIPTHQNPRNFVRNGEPVGELEGFSSHLVAEEGIRWLEQRDRDKPFYLHVCFHEPHEKVESPDELVEQYMPVARDRDEAEYFANVENMDAAVGKLMRALEEQGVADETLVFFTSDNGPETLDRYGGANRSYGSASVLRGRKLWLYEGGIRVPGIIRFPGRIEPRTIEDEPVSGVDLLPTLCELAGVDVPDDRPIDGTSFTPIFENEPIEREKPLFWHYYRAIGRPKAAMRDGDWMILGHWSGPENPVTRNVDARSVRLIKNAELVDFQLYNMAIDAMQRRNLADEYPDRLKRLKKRLLERYKAVVDEGPGWGLLSGSDE